MNVAYHIQHVTIVHYCTCQSHWPTVHAATKPRPLAVGWCPMSFTVAVFLIITDLQTQYRMGLKRKILIGQRIYNFS